MDAHESETAIAGGVDFADSTAAVRPGDGRGDFLLWASKKRIRDDAAPDCARPQISTAHIGRIFVKIGNEIQ
jgi:hypothetical protein